MTSNSLRENEERDIPSQILKIIFGLHASVIFKTPICVVSSAFEGSSDTKLQWSIGRTNSLYYSTRVDLYSHQILLCEMNSLIEIVGRSPIGNKSALVYVMSWCLKGNKPLLEPMLTKVYDATVS